MRKTLTLLIIILASNFVNAQFIKEKLISAQVGLGRTAPNRSTDQVDDNGFFAQGELILKIASWVEFRPYTGFIRTSTDGKDFFGNPSDEKAISKALLIGSKARLLVPIPGLSPYIEVGIGTSIGRFVTSTTFDDIEKTGIIYHTPFTLGVVFGKKRKVDLGYSVYDQPSVKQIVGAFAVGITFRLNN